MKKVLKIVLILAVILLALGIAPSSEPMILPIQSFLLPINP